MATTVQPSSGRLPKRGDLVILSTEARASFQGGRATETSQRFSVGVITSVSRTGQIKTANVPFLRDAEPSPVNVTRTPGTAHHAPASRYDVQAILNAYAQHTYAGSTQVRPYDNATQLRAMIDTHSTTAAAAGGRIAAARAAASTGNS